MLEFLAAGVWACSLSWLRVLGHACFLECPAAWSRHAAATAVCHTAMGRLHIQRFVVAGASSCSRFRACVCVACSRHAAGFWSCLISWLQVLVMLVFSGLGCPRKARCCQGCLPEGTRQAALAAACPEQAASSAHKHTHTRRNLLLPARPAPEVAGWRQVSRNARILGCRFLVMLSFLAARAWPRLFY